MASAVISSTARPLRLEERVRGYARDMPDRPAIITPQLTLSWLELDRLADSLAAFLCARGARVGDRIGWLARNRAEHGLLLLAARRARLVVAGLNWRLSPAELDYIVRDAAPHCVLGDVDFQPLLPPGTDFVPLDSGNDGSLALLSRLRIATPPVAFAGEPALAEDAAQLYYTSGTTGRPKGVVFSLDGVEQAVRAPQPHQFQSDSVLLIAPPVFHIAGATWTQYGLFYGLTQVLLPMATPAGLLDAIEKHGVTHTVLVPTLVQVLLAEQRRQPRNLSSLQSLGYGAAPMPPALLREAATLLRCRFVQAYGLTECLTAVCHLPPDAHRLDGTADDGPPATGFPDAGVELRIADTNNGSVLETGERGEVWIRFPWPRPRYRSLPPGARPAFDADGWLHTGDIGFIDANGCLHLVDRLGDMIISGGENIYPAEVEAVLAEHAAVADAAVVGMPHPRWGQQVIAAVTTRPGAELDTAQLVEWCRTRLAHYKCPRFVVLVQQLPRNATGKVLRADLREQLSILGKQRPEWDT